MTTIGGHALLICLFLVAPIAVFRRSTSIDACRLWRVAPPVLAVCYVAAWTLGPAIFWLPFNSFFSSIKQVPAPSPPFLAPVFWVICLQAETLAPQSQLFRFAALIPDTCIYTLAVTTILARAKRNDEREDLARRKRIHDAIDRIAADGKVTGPKGPYVPHRKWNVGLGKRTPHDTKPDVHGGPYGNPVP